MAVALGVVLQMLALGVPPSADRGSTLGTTSPATIDGPGEPPLPGSQPRMPAGELDTLTAEGAGEPTTFTPPPTAPAPTYFPATLFPTAPSTVEAATARVNAEGGQLTRDEMVAVLRAAGWPESVIPDALAVAWCESRYSPYAINGGNFGLFQMNATDAATIRGPWFRYWGLPEDAWSDPVTNATAARLTYEYSLARNGYGWSPWSCRPS